MAVESLRKTGLYFDDLNKIRVLDPEASQKTNLLKDECKEYVNSKYSSFNDFEFCYKIQLNGLSCLRQI